MIYFDNAATTYPKPECVYQACQTALMEYSFNAGRGSYSCARNTFKMIENTRGKVASLIAEPGDKVVFTSSATEAIDNIIYGLNLQKNDTVLISPFEHNAVVRTLHNIGVNLVLIPFNVNSWELERDGFINLLVLKHPKAVIISQISNVTGYELPYEMIFSESKKFGCVNILDSSQSYGVHYVNKANVDILVFAGHKSLYAIFGVAGFINISSIKLKVCKVGGTGSDSLNLEMPTEMPHRYEAGSMNAIAIYTLNKSIEFLSENAPQEYEKSLTEYLVSQLKTIRKVIIYLPQNYIPFGIVSINVEGYSSDEVGMILSDDYDICVRTGHHCSPFVSEFIGAQKYNGTVRISLGLFNTIEQINVLIEALRGL